jgi:hypothetical protein
MGLREVAEERKREKGRREERDLQLTLVNILVEVLDATGVEGRGTTDASGYASSVSCSRRRRGDKRKKGKRPRRVSFRSDEGETATTRLGRLREGNAHSVDLVALLQEELRQVRTILTRNS